MPNQIVRLYDNILGSTDKPVAKKSYKSMQYYSTGFVQRVFTMLASQISPQIYKMQIGVKDYQNPKP
jgi:hypothetical protein